MQAPAKILIVDDLPENILVLDASLRREHLTILSARSGAEALETLLKHDVALAILDVQMPEMDGFELAELMQGSERTRHVPILFLTAGSQDEVRVFRGYESGAVDFLYKPYDARILSSKVDVFVELHRKRQELDESLRVSQLFVGILGHDLRNPLSAIRTGAHLLKKGVAKERQEAIAGSVLNSAGRMAHMIEDILDFTRVRLGNGIPLTLGEHDLGALTSTILDEARLADDAPSLVLEVAGYTRVQCDAERMLQLLSNLVGNAVQHGAPGEPIFVRLRAAEREVVLEVRNRGSIPRHLLSCIFDPFRRAGVKQDGSSAGLGLGLYISQQIVAAHGGELSVESGDETVFTVRLPRRLLS